MGSSSADTSRIAAGMPAWSLVTERGVLDREHPQHLVTFSRPFGLGKYPVTRAEFAAFVRETKYADTQDCTVHEGHKFLFNVGATWQKPGFRQTDRDPVVCINFQDAKAYIEWLNKKVRRRLATESEGPYYLPSEAEWEYAARAETQTAYWWGDVIGTGNAVCNSCGSPWDDKETAPTDNFHANRFGLHEMLGNVWEITEDCWHPNYIGAPTDGSAWLTGGECLGRMTRGGSWFNDPWQIRTAYRTHGITAKRANFQGFRVAKIL